MVVGDRRGGGFVCVCRQLGVLVAVEQFTTVLSRPNGVCKARLQALQRYLNTSSAGNIVKVSCRIAVEVIQQALADLSPHGFSTVYGMSHSTESAVAIGYHLGDFDERPESTFAQGSVLPASRVQTPHHHCP